MKKVTINDCKKYYQELILDNKNWIYFTSPFVSKIDIVEELKRYNSKNPNLSFVFIFISFVKYYLRLFFYFINFLNQRLAYLIYEKKITKEKFDKSIYIDTYLLSNKIFYSSQLLEGYFPLIDDVIVKAEWNLVIIPRMVWNYNVIEPYLIYKKLRDKKHTILTEQHLLTFKDGLIAFLYSLIYPIYFLNIYKKFPKNHIGEFLRYFFFRSFNGTNYLYTLRYKFGTSLAKLAHPNDKLIQWYENQPYDKCLNISLRGNNSKISIIGSQLFLKPIEMINYDPDSNFGNSIIPDKILVNGAYFQNNFENKVGPSLRYQSLFQTEIKTEFNIKNRGLFLFSYFESVNNHLLDFFKIIEMKSERWIFKFHPANDCRKYKNLDYSQISVSQASLYDLIPEIDLIIGSSSGSLVEAIACGVPVVFITNKGQIEYSYLPDFCKGVLWEGAYDKESFEIAKANLFSVIENQNDIRIEMIHKVRREMFCEPTNERIIEAFEL